LGSNVCAPVRARAGAGYRASGGETPAARSWELSLGTGRAHLIRAVIDGPAGSVALLARAVAADLGQPLTALRVDGGLTRSRLLLQAQADLLPILVEVPRAPTPPRSEPRLWRPGTGEAASLAPDCRRRPDRSRRRLRRHDRARRRRQQGLIGPRALALARPLVRV
jgi:hypothetical protein